VGFGREGIERKRWFSAEILIDIFLFVINIIYRFFYEVV